MVTFYLVRHGYSVANEKKFFAGSSDVPLSQIGMQQAELVSNYIISNLKIDKIFSSELSRAYNTVSKIGKALMLEIVKNPSFNEIYAGSWEMLNFQDIMRDFEHDYECWKGDIYNSRCTNGESFQELKSRTFAELKKLALENEGEHILIATHAGVIRSLITEINNLTAKECSELGWVSNASITTVIYDNNCFTIKSISYDDYLKSLATSLPKTI